MRFDCRLPAPLHCCHRIYGEEEDDLTCREISHLVLMERYAPPRLSSMHGLDGIVYGLLVGLCVSKFNVWEEGSNWIAEQNSWPAEQYSERLLALTYIHIIFIFPGFLKFSWPCDWILAIEMGATHPRFSSWDVPHHQPCFSLYSIPRAESKGS